MLSIIEGLRHRKQFPCNALRISPRGAFHYRRIKTSFLFFSLLRLSRVREVLSIIEGLRPQTSSRVSTGKLVREVLSIIEGLRHIKFFLLFLVDVREVLSIIEGLRPILLNT